METVKLKIFSQVAIFLLLSVCIAEAASTLTVIGRNPFIIPPLENVDDLHAMMEKMPEEVQLGLEKAGYGQLYKPMMEQLPEAQIDRVDYGKGETFQWMFYKRHGKGTVRIAKDVLWAAENTFPGFEFYVDDGGKRYTFTVPLGCGNLALKDIAAVPVTPPPPAPVAPMVKEEPPIQIAPVQEMAPEVVEEPGPFRFVADGGYLHQMNSGDYGLARLGFSHQLSDSFSYLAMMGAAVNFNDNTDDDGVSAVLVDVIGQYNWSRWFAGIGLGGWITSGDSSNESEDTDVDLILNLGTRIFGEPDAFNGSLFVEGRAALGEFNELDDYARIGLGLRCLF